MPLTIEQKSVYLLILNATMILRSVGKTFHRNKEKLKQFKKITFIEVKKLTEKIESKQLQEEDIIVSIKRIVDKCGISFGQAQKGINVLLKYHYYLSHISDNSIKALLYCPLDSKVLEKMNIYLSLTQINEEEYMNIQKLIAKRSKARIDFDRIWDEQHVRAEGI